MTVSLSDPPPRLLRAQLEEVNSDILQQRLERKKYLEVFKLKQQALNTKQHELETKLSLIVYPVLTLPPEVTTRFFVACLPDGCVRPSSKSVPLSLAQVCHHWREIAISTPELWVSPEICFDLRRRGVPPSGDGNLHSLENWFSRSRNRPLSVRIYSSSGKIPSSMISLLSSVTARLHFLDLDLCPKDLRALGRATHAFPNLKSLAVSSSYHPLAHYDPLSIFSNVPSLSELRIAHEPSQWDCYPLLSSLSLGRIHFHSVSKVLQACPRLLHLSANVRDVPEGFFQPPVLPAPQLQSLILENSDSSLSTLPPLILPGLRRLELDTSDHAAFLWIPPLVSISSCLLQHLSLGFDHDRPVEFIVCLHTIPTLTSIIIAVDGPLVEFMHVVNADPPPLPRLCYLTIFLGHPGTIQFVEERRAAVTPPSSGFVRLNPNEGHWQEAGDWLSDEEGSVPEIERFIAQGWEVRVSNGKDIWPEEFDDK
ncbi:hypothetical protein C8R47DRAFT_1020782 [Mycena vitilis]|nr:hypothetical protein C8R47DRAFT_1020782 [Mycena vitilis]